MLGKSKKLPSIKEIVQDFIVAALSYGINILKKPGIDNDLRRRMIYVVDLKIAGIKATGNDDRQFDEIIKELDDLLGK